MIRTPSRTQAQEASVIRMGYLARMAQYRTDEDLPPLAAPPDASDTERNRAIVARMVARHGAPSLEDYRRVYAARGRDWPGDDEVRRRHPVAAPAA